jgi:hypothetical protein
MYVCTKVKSKGNILYAFSLVNPEKPIYVFSFHLIYQSRGKLLFRLDGTEEGMDWGGATGGKWEREPQINMAYIPAHFNWNLVVSFRIYLFCLERQGTT